jgi:3-hydroxyacyl-CoA dehydrogenase
MNGYIRKAAVLGSGAMASGIAAHLANAGVPTLLLGRIPKELTEEEKAKKLGFDDYAVRNRASLKCLNRIAVGKPPALYDAGNAALITPGNYDDDLDKLAEVDWIIESVVENLAVKKELLERAVKYRKPGAVLSTNTSGISINAICKDLPLEARQHFLATHFFNPARYMKLLEIVPSDDAIPEVVDFIAEYCERVLGKGIVKAKDTSNFIANRIGILGGNGTIQSMIELGMTVEEVDAVTGIPMGRPPLATFMLQDMVGLDVCVLSAGNVYNSLSDPEEKALVATPQFQLDMVEKGVLGDKAGQGWYKKSKDSGERLYLDYNTMEYAPLTHVKFDSVEATKKTKDVKEKFNILVYADDKAGKLAWEITKKIVLYAGDRLPEIADDIVSIDNAMKWGYNWELGPFENWDAIGVEKSVARMKKEGAKISQVALDLLAGGKSSFYAEIDGKKHCYDFKSKEYVPMREQSDLIDLKVLREAGKTIKSNPAADLIDMGDGVACLELHPAGNVTNREVIEMLNLSAEEVEKNYRGLVITGQNFNLPDTNYKYILELAKKKDITALDEYLKDFQDALMRIKYCNRPVVAAAGGKIRGNGLEICLHTHKIRAAAESSVGFTDILYGLIPAGGGCKELVSRGALGVADDRTWLHPMSAKIFDLITKAKPVSSAPAAVAAGIFRKSDGISINGDYLLFDAKRDVLELNEKRFIAPQPAPLRVLGEEGCAGLSIVAYMIKEGGFISEYDELLYQKTAHVLSGGKISPNSKVDEKYLLDLERITLSILAANAKTQERAEAMISTGKPFRN